MNDKGLGRTGSGLLALALLAGSHTGAQATEYPIGEAVTAGGMEVAAVYLQPVAMEPAGMMLAAAEADIHLEADIRALANNPNGFAKGSWVPYMRIGFELTKQGSDETRQGRLMPMVASDGPHYGDNVKLMGPGKYRLVFKVAPPAGEGAAHFGRHTDKETGVAAWFAPFTAEYDLIFAGTGKKGSY